MTTARPSALVLYHYLYPDQVVSSVLFTDLCIGLQRRGWTVTGSACDRGWKDESKTHPKRETWQGVEFLRVRRPRFRQSSGFGRAANALWMIASWSLMALNPRIRPDVLIVGTDPILSLTVSLWWRLCRPGVRVAHWCFDLYPEAAVAAGLVRKDSAFTSFVQILMERSYRSCGLIVDIGSCMRSRLKSYGFKARSQTITPWALAETEQPSLADAEERERLFQGATLGLLYSGSFGRAHSCLGIADLARILVAGGGRIVFGVQGNAAEDLRAAMKEADAPVTFAEYAEGTQDLERRLAAADVHIVSLHQEWTGTVVPSKFFGALAIGRPVLFIGSPDSAIARWIEEFSVGWVVAADNVAFVAAELLAFASDSDAKAKLFEHCHRTYTQNFSKEHALDRWDHELKSLIGGVCNA